MEIVLRPVAREDPDTALLEGINREAIPENERNSLYDLFDTGEDGNLSVLGIYVRDIPAGFLAVRSYREIRYLAYLAVRKDLRSRGIGGQALRILIGRSPGRQVVVEFEAPDGSGAADDLRKRRKKFYLRNGFYETGWYTYYDGAEFEIACSQPVFDAAAFDGFIRYLSTIVSDHIPGPYRKDR